MSHDRDPQLEETVQQRYRIVSNGRDYQVQRRNFLGWWSMVKSSLKLRSYRGGYCCAEDLEDAKAALQCNVEREVEKIQARRHGWKKV